MPTALTPHIGAGRVVAETRSELGTVAHLRWGAELSTLLALLHSRLEVLCPRSATSGQSQLLGHYQEEECPVVYIHAQEYLSVAVTGNAGCHARLTGTAVSS